MITDNRFSVDSIAEHAERLLLMQQNFAAHSLVFASMEDEPREWALTCYTDFQAKRIAAEHQDAQSKAATTAATIAFHGLRRVYIALRTYARQRFANDGQSLDSYKLTMTYPTTQYDQLSLVSAFFTEHTRRTEAHEPSPFPGVLIEQLAAAFAKADQAFQAKSSVRKLANHTRLAYMEQQKAGIQNLKLFYALATVVWKSDDRQFNDLGFVRPEQIQAGRGGTTAPKAPTGLRMTSQNILEWSPVPGATSYSISTSDDGENWQSEQSSEVNALAVRAAVTGKIYYRVRARNAGGYGEYSDVFDHLFGLAVTDGITYDSGELSWDEIEFAFLYEAERAPRGSNAFVRIYTGSDTTAFDTPPSGTWTYRVRGLKDAIKGGWADVTVVQG